MIKKFLFAMLFSVTFGVGHFASAADITQKEVEAFVSKAGKYIKDHGKDEAFKKFSNQLDKDFHEHDGELYMYVYDYKCLNLAHGARASLVGQPAFDLKDPDGLFVIQELAKIAKEKKKGNLIYKWANPIHKKVEKKVGYVEDVNGEYFIGSGYYPAGQ